MINSVIKEQDVEVLYTNIPTGKPIVWVIDGNCLYDLPVKDEYVDMFLNSDLIEDITSEYPEHIGMAIRFSKSDQFVYDFLTSEYFGSILLSQPLVLDISQYAYGKYVQSPFAKFDGEKFIITNRDMSSLLKWPVGHPRASEN